MNRFFTFYFKILLIYFSIIASPAFAQAPNWLWAKNASGQGVSNFGLGESIVTDAMGNVYVGGYFDGPEITLGSYTLTSPGNSNENLLFVKYDPDGNVLWAKSAVCSYANSITSLALDASGNIYILGRFYASNITLGSTTLINAGSSDFFIAKYDPDGNLFWVKNFGSNGFDYGASLKIGESGDIYIAGHFDSNSISIGTVILNKTGNNQYNMFVAKFDSNGNAIWATKATGENDSYAYSIAVDVSGNTFVSGQFSSPAITFGTYTLTKLFLDGGTASYDIFLTKFDNSGNLVWAKSAGSSRNSSSNSVSVDHLGNVFLAGDFSSPTITLGSITVSNFNPEYTDIFLAKYDASGNVAWAINAGGTYNEVARSIATDTFGNVYVIGYFESSSITFGAQTLTNQYPQSGKLYITKYDTYGNALWVKSIFETGSFGRAITVDGMGNVLITGSTGVLSLHFDSILLNFSKSDFNSFTAKLGNFSVDVLHTDVSCYGGNDGTASAVITGGTAPFTYLWNTTPARTTDTAMGLSAGNYSVTVTDALGMIAIGNVVIGQSDLIQSVTEQQICHGDSLLFKGKYYNDNMILYDTIPASNGCDSIIQLFLVMEPEYITQQVSDICQGGVYDFYGTPLTTSGRYDHKLFSLHGCDSTISINLTVYPTFKTDNPQSVCNGESYAIGQHIYTLAVNYPDTLKSISGCDSIILTQLTVNPSFHFTDQQTICSGNFYSYHGSTYAASGNYFDSLTTSHGCDSIFELSLTIAPPDTTKLIQPICQGDNYTFYGASLTKTGIYYHTFNSALGCDSIIKLNLSVNSLPVSDMENEIRIPIGYATQLNVTGGISYQWTPSDYLNDPTIANPVTKPQNNISYFVTITDQNGCTSTDTVNVFVEESYIWFPNAFTPNDDKINDVFRPKARNISRFTMSVFNRWGQFLFETSDIEEGWNGIFKDEKCPNDMYIYIATYEFMDTGDTKTVRGSFTLLR